LSRRILASLLSNCLKVTSCVSGVLSRLICISYLTSEIPHACA
jgi:hypothetical protein